MAGIRAAMQLIGWDQFYGDLVAFDALTVSVKSTPPQLAAALVDLLSPAEPVAVEVTARAEPRRRGP